MTMGHKIKVRTRWERGTIPRRCLRCRGRFMSQGAHNRLCGTCRVAEVSPYEPDFGKLE